MYGCPLYTSRDPRQQVVKSDGFLDTLPATPEHFRPGGPVLFPPHKAPEFGQPPEDGAESRGLRRRRLGGGQHGDDLSFVLGKRSGTRHVGSHLPQTHEPLEPPRHHQAEAEVR